MVLTITEFDSLYVPFQQAVEQATDIYANNHIKERGRQCNGRQRLIDVTAILQKRHAVIKEDITVDLYEIQRAVDES